MPWTDDVTDSGVNLAYAVTPPPNENFAKHEFFPQQNINTLSAPCCVINE
jgi:hypothetical protein